MAFAREALAKGATKVYAGMRKTDGFSEPGLISVQIDVTDPESIKRAAAQCDDVSDAQQHQLCRRISFELGLSSASTAQPPSI